MATSLLACLGNVVGCQTTPFELRVVSKDGEFHFVLRYPPMEENRRYDLDGLEHIIIVNDGVTYRFYPHLGIAVEVGTNRVYRLDIEDLQRLLDALGIDGLQHFASVATMNETTTMNSVGAIGGVEGVFESDNQNVTLELKLRGDVPIPQHSDEQWPSLEQELYIFPDGVKGSPDELLLALSGDREDVLRYLLKLGIEEATFNVGESEWLIQWSKEANLIDVFCNEILMFSVDPEQN